MVRVIIIRFLAERGKPMQVSNQFKVMGKEARKRHGFTLMEMLVVVAIIVVLAGAGIPIYMSFLQGAKRDVAARGVKTLENAALAFSIRHGYLPQHLEDMCVMAPDGGPPTLEQKALYDPWNQPYIYNMGAIGVNGAPQIMSSGPPGSGLTISNF